MFHPSDHLNPARMQYFRPFLLVTLALFVGACGETSNSSRTAGEGDANRGRQIYLAQCAAACHASDPSTDGAIGPAVKGSSRALLEARILRGEYPPGYTPKRKSSIMPPQPHLEGGISDLAAFLK